MKLRLNKVLRCALLSCMAGAGVAVASTTYVVDGVDLSNLQESERFYDTGKGYYWKSYHLDTVRSLYNSTGSMNFLGDLSKKVDISSGITASSFNALDDDSDTCWYQVTSNVLQYWQSYYGVFYKGERPLVNGYNYDKEYVDDLGGTQSLKLGSLFYDNWENAGGNLVYGIWWYLQGYEYEDATLKTEGQGGYFSNFYGEDEEGYLSDVRPEVTPNNFVVEELRHFVDCLNTGKTPVSPMEDALTVQKMLDAIYRSAEAHAEVTV